MARRLQAGITAIGEINGKDNRNMIQKFTILYGNVADPIVDGKIMHLREDLYKDMLNKFLESEEGKKYQIPSDDEVEQAIIDMRNREEEVKQKEAEQVAQQEKTEELTVFEEQPQEAQPQIPFEMDKEVVVTQPPKKNKFVIGVLSGLLALSLVSNAVQLFSKTLSGKEVTLTVDEESYKIPVEDLKVEDGESKIIIYGIGRTSDGTNVSTKVIPLGQFDLNKPIKAIVDEEVKTQTEETEPATDSETKDTTEEGGNPNEEDEGS